MKIFIAVLATACAAGTAFFSMQTTNASEAADVLAGPAWQPRVVTRAEMTAARKAHVGILTHLFGGRAEMVSRFNRIDERFVRAGTTLRVPDLPEGTEYVPLPKRYPDAAGRPKFILLSLDAQFLGAYENGEIVASFPVSTGREGYPTPTGDFAVTAKNPDAVSSKYPEPDGGAPMPWALRFRGRMYWMHGGDLVGAPASHGCVRLRNRDAEWLFTWAPIGTPFTIVRSLQ